VSLYNTQVFILSSFQYSDPSSIELLQKKIDKIVELSEEMKKSEENTKVLAAINSGSIC